MQSNTVWAHVELMGHRRFLGPVDEVSIFGGKLGRVMHLLPSGEFQEHLFGSSSIYCLTILDEETIRHMAAPRPLVHNDEPVDADAWMDPFEDGTHEADEAAAAKPKRTYVCQSCGFADETVDPFNDESEPPFLNGLCAACAPASENQDEPTEPAL